MIHLDKFFERHKTELNPEKIISVFVEAKINPENCYILDILHNPRRMFFLENISNRDSLFICITLCDDYETLKIHKFPQSFILHKLSAYIEYIEEKDENN